MSEKKEMLVGGQAVIEGVMMRSPRFYAVCLRRADGSITTKIEKFKTITKKYPVLAKPFFRGIVMLFETMVLGVKTLAYSADVYAEDLDEEAEEDTKKKEKRKKKRGKRRKGIG